MGSLTKKDVQIIFEDQFDEVSLLFGGGQSEYARDTKNPFGNFERVADYLGLDRKVVLLVYALKHMDGICSHIIDGHTSQREDIRGRIGDLITYLCLLRGMLDEEDESY